jgi:hypothetical protein
MPDNGLPSSKDTCCKPAIPPLPLRLVIEMKDLTEIRFAHFLSAESLTMTFLDFPDVLQNRLRPILRSMQQQCIERIDHNSDRKDQTLANQLPFNLHILREDEDFEELFSLVLWWIKRDQRKFRCAPDSFHGTQPHKTWMCECGVVVSVEKEFVEICDNSLCPSWKKYRLCTGKSPRNLLRLA